MTIATVDNMENVYANLASTLQQQGIDALLPTHVTPEQFIRTAATALVENHDLQCAEKSSLVLTLTRCARDGLLPDGREAAMVVRNTKNSNGQYEKRVVYMPMIDGLLKRARQSGQVSSIFSDAVYAADEFKRWTDERGKHFKHTSNDTDERGDLRLVYAAAKLKNGDFLMEVMTRAEVDAIRNEVKSADKDSSPWKKQYREMAIKTVTKRLCKRLPGASETYPLLDVGYSDDTEHAVSVTPSSSTKNARPRLRDVLNQPRFTPEKEVKPTAVQETAPEPESAPPELEALLVALDDVNDEQSYRVVAEPCKTLAKTLSDAHRGVLREKMTKTLDRVRKSPGGDDRHAKTQTPVALAEGHKDTMNQPGIP